MRWRSLSAAAVLAVTFGLAGFSVTGCQNLSVGPQLQNPDSTRDPNLDDPDAPPPGTSVVPIELSGLGLESGEVGR